MSDDWDDATTRHNAADTHVRVMNDMCKTCIFRPGNLMHLPPGRVAGMVKDSIAADSAIICHSTLYDGEQPKQAVCRGFFDRYAKDSLPLRLAVALDLVQEWELPEGARHA